MVAIEIRSSASRVGAFIIIVGGFLLTPRAATAQYTSQVLTALPAPPGVSVDIDTPTASGALNGAGQVFGEVIARSPDNRPVPLPVLWTDGVPRYLPIPSNYEWDGVVGQEFMNDSGTVVSRVTPSSVPGIRVVRWTNDGSGTIVPTRPSCPDGTGYFPMGLNNNGRVLILSLISPGYPCDGILWIWDGTGGSDSDFTEIGPVRRDISPGNIGAGGCSPGYVIRFDSGRHLNDADHIAIEYYDGFGPGCPSSHDPSLFAGILADGNFDGLIPLPGAFNAGAAAGIADINTSDQFVAFVGDNNAPDVKYWDRASIVDLGPGAGVYLNDLGQVLFSALPGPIPRIYKNGAVTDVPVPQQIPGFCVAPAYGVDTDGINLAGQVLLSMWFQCGGPLGPITQHPVLRTPTPPTITWGPLADIPYGTQLGPAQLNATASDAATGASVAGVFVYTPPDGTILDVGDNQPLSADFTPTPLGYANATKGNTINVKKAPVDVVLSSSVNPSVFGQAVQFEAVLSATPVGAQPATGSVSFSDGAVPLGSAPIVNTNGVLSASITTSTLGVGPHSIGAHYSGDTTHYLSADATLLSQLVNQAATTTALTSSLNPSNVGQAVTLTATVSVSSPGQGTPSGTVQFFDGSTLLGSSPVAPAGGNVTATFVTSALSSGTHSLTATYDGDTNFARSTSGVLSQVVNAPAPTTTTSLKTSANPVAAGQSITLTAIVAATSGTVRPSGQVTFFDGDTAMGTASLALSQGKMKATLTTTSLTVGTHLLTVMYLGNTTLSSSVSLPFAETIYSGSTPVATTTSLTSSANPASVGQAITFTATVKGSKKSVPTGTVQFFADGNVIGSVGLTAGRSASTAQLSGVQQLGTGTHTVYGLYLGDSRSAASVSAALSQVVQ
jgi:hypothetical protein